MHNKNVTVINAWQFEWTISGNKSILMAWMNRKKKLAYSVLKPVHYFVFLNTLILEAMMGEKNYSTVVTSIYDVFCDFCKQRNSFFFFFLVMPHSSSTVRWVNLLILTVRLKPLTERWNKLPASLTSDKKARASAFVSGLPDSFNLCSFASHGFHRSQKHYHVKICKVKDITIPAFRKIYMLQSICL